MKLFRITLISIFLIFGIFFFLLSLGYRDWEKKIFFGDSKVVCFSGIDERILYIDQKIEDFILSDSKTEFVTLTSEEIASIFKSNIQVGKSVQLIDLCILPSEGTWSLYLKYKIGAIPVPWIVLEIVKDDRETAEIYVKKVYIGKNSIPSLLSKQIVVNINSGISDAIILVNENRFLGRNIKNIELLEERVVLKGSL